eukprot:INCI20381.1.p1 GENE.INCI20381.1~~INCI20381.1.p1  ORF type:complete len:188 (+),score=15.19 INCI20381.1:56-565(+)
MSLVLPSSSNNKRCHRSVQSVVTTPASPALVEMPRPASADSPRHITAPAFVPAPRTQSPKSPLELGNLNPTFFKPVLAGSQRRPSSSSCLCNKEPTLGSLRRQCATRSLKAPSMIGPLQDFEFPIKRRGAARNLLSVARKECGARELEQKASPAPFRIQRFLEGEPVCV